jgi:hypothetical protein
VGGIKSGDGDDGAPLSGASGMISAPPIVWARAPREAADHLMDAFQLKKAMATAIMVNEETIQAAFPVSPVFFVGSSQVNAT